MSDNVLLSVVDDVARIELARAEKANSLDDVLLAELAAAFAKAEQHQVRAIVLSGQGKHLCAGADIQWLRASAAASDDEFRVSATTLAKLLLQFRLSRFPVIVVAKGSCFGGGAGLCCAADITVADETAKFKFSEAKLGIIAATIGPHVVSAIGVRNARRYLITAEMIDAKHAQRLGIVHEVHPAAELDNAVTKILASIRACGPKAVSVSKRLVATLGNMGVDVQTAEHTVDELTAIRSTEEAQEGLSAFLEKRSPQWGK